MSLRYNVNTATELGIIQLIEDELGWDRGYITDNSDEFRRINALVNLAIDTYTDIAIKTSGTAQFDDTNYSSHLPIVYFDLVSGQKEYNATTDEDGALILEYHKVGILESASDTTYSEIQKVDQQSTGNYSPIFEETSANAAPYSYDQTGSSLILEPAPDYNATDGLKAAISREAQHFDTSDTTKRPGVPGIHHEYFVVKPAYLLARRYSLTTAELEKAVVDYEGSERLRITGKIADHFGRRERDKKHIMTPSRRQSLRNYPPM